MKAIPPGLRSFYSKLREWVNNRNTREQVLLLAALATLGTWIFLSAIIWPLNTWREDQQRAASAWESRLQWLETQPRTQIQSQLRPGVLTSSVGDCGPELLRVNQEGSSVVVAVQEQSFDCLLDWLIRLEGEHGIQADQLRLQASPREGGVTGTLRFSES